MGIPYQGHCLPQLRALLIQQLLPSPDPTLVPRPAQVTHPVMTPLLPLLKTLLYL